VEDAAVFEAPVSRAFYAARVSEFLKADPAAIVGRLSARNAASHGAAEREQIEAWGREIAILGAAFDAIGPECLAWSVLLEVPLLRLGKRIDAVVLAPGVVCVVEFKIGAVRYEAADRLQTEGYAQGLRDFHAHAQGQVVVPILCAEKAPARPVALHRFDRVARLIEANADTLAEALRAAADAEGPAFGGVSMRSKRDQGS
jgi:hypothetical protein